MCIYSILLSRQNFHINAYLIGYTVYISAMFSFFNQLPGPPVLRTTCSVGGEQGWRCSLTIKTAGKGQVGKREALGQVGTMLFCRQQSWDIYSICPFMKNWWMTQLSRPPTGHPGLQSALLFLECWMCCGELVRAAWEHAASHSEHDRITQTWDRQAMKVEKAQQSVQWSSVSCFFLLF